MPFVVHPSLPSPYCLSYAVYPVGYFPLLTRLALRLCLNYPVFARLPNPL